MKCRCDKAKLSLSVTGVRGSFTNVPDTGTVKDGAIGVGLAGRPIVRARRHDARLELFHARRRPGGLRGRARGTIDIGYRVPAAEDHGPFGRIGFDGRIQGNDFLLSLLELPATLGWQYLKGTTVSR